MIHNLRSRVLPVVDVVFSAAVNLLTPVSVVNDSGGMSSTSEFKSFDIAGSLAPFKSSDFSIVNLEQIGALSKLKTTYMSNMHDMNVADKFDGYEIEVEVPQS